MRQVLTVDNEANCFPVRTFIMPFSGRSSSVTAARAGWPLGDLRSCRRRMRDHGDDRTALLPRHCRSAAVAVLSYLITRSLLPEPSVKTEPAAAYCPVG